MKKIIILIIVGLVLVAGSVATGYVLTRDKPKTADSGLSDAQQQEIDRLQKELDTLKENKDFNEAPASTNEPTTGGATPQPTPQSTPQPTPQPATPKKTVLADLGDFKIVYSATQSPQYTEMNRLIKGSGIFEETASFLNLLLILQKDFPITFKECGFVNAYYTLATKEIFICDELVENFAQNFVYFVSSEAELDKAVTDATFFILFHELGHGLIDIYDLTYSGKEEDVADQLSTLVLVNLGEDGAKAAITGANLFYITSSNIDAGSYPFWDEHSLNQQRYYNILCWVYGSDPQKYSNFVGVYGLPQERAVRCQREYENMSEFWDVAIEPFVKEEFK